ncbi:disease resistance protein RUN1-like isoform X2 [Carya illinoinensis]|nr:disease resistance protein RUN1-like isoform X2 [Carya illinoinensis]
MICLHSEAFRKMSNLRLFINQNAQFSAGPNYLSNEIRVLDWPQYPSSFLPSNFRGNNLIEFKMRGSLIKEIGGLKFKNLTDMDLRYCKFLTKISDLSSSPNLEKLNLGHCKNLVEVHHSVGFLDMLLRFSVSGCCKLRILPKRFKLRSLRFFDLGYCSSLEDFPEIECEMGFLHELNLFGTSIKELPSSIENLKGLKTLYLYGTSIKELPSSIGNLPQLQQLYAAGCIDQLRSLRIVKVDSYSQPINIGKVEEDGIQSTPSVVSLGEYEIPSTTTELTTTNSSIFNDGSSSSSAIWKSLSLRVLTLQFCCLSESNFFTNGNYFPALDRLDLSGSDIVIFPAHSVRFPRLRRLCLNNCKKLEEILPLPSSISTFEARECTSLESFAILSEILIKGNGMNFSNFLRIELYGCHKLLANMRPIPSCEERHSKDENWAYPLKVRDINIIFPGKRIPGWFNYCEEAHDSNSCEIDINRLHHWNDIDEIVFYVVFRFRVGIINPRMEKAYICVSIHDGLDWKKLYTENRKFYWTDSDHVWMHWMSYDEQVDISRFRFECKSEVVVFRSVGIHFLKNHEENVRDDIGVPYENDYIDLGYPFSYSNSDEGGDSWLDFMDEKRHSSISELENDDENPKETFGKRHRDEYDSNLEFNMYPQQKRQYSSTMGIIITELENDDEYPKEDMDLELKLGL